MLNTAHNAPSDVIAAIHADGRAQKDLTEAERTLLYTLLANDPDTMERVVASVPVRAQLIHSLGMRTDYTDSRAGRALDLVEHIMEQLDKRIADIFMEIDC